MLKLFRRKLPRKGQKGTVNANRKFRNKLNDILVAFSKREKREVSMRFWRKPEIKAHANNLSEHKCKSLNYKKRRGEKKKKEKFQLL